jgi:hypothetical protein
MISNVKRVVERRRSVSQLRREQRQIDDLTFNMPRAMQAEIRAMFDRNNSV